LSCSPASIPDDGAIAVPFRPRRLGHCDALNIPSAEALGVLRIAMLIASDRDHPGPRPAAIVIVIDHRVARESTTVTVQHKRWRPVPSGGRVRSEDLLLPPGGSVTGLAGSRPRSFRSTAETVFLPGLPGQSKPTKPSARHRCICGSPDSVRRLPEACFPILLRASH
jgi:hypothetical protein